VSVLFNGAEINPLARARSHCKAVFPVVKLKVKRMPPAHHVYFSFDLLCDFIARVDRDVASSLTEELIRTGLLSRPRKREIFVFENRFAVERTARLPTMTIYINR